MRKTLSTLAVGASVFFGPSLWAKSVQAPSQQLMDLGSEAFIYGYPLVLMDVTREAMTVGMNGVSTINHFSHARTFPSPASTATLSPDADTLASIGWLDLSDEPIIFSIPEMGDRYFFMPILDAWSNVVSSPGTRTTGGRAQNWALVGPNWKGELPLGVQKIEVMTNTAWINGRILAKGPEDFAAVHALQDQLKLVPLSAWGSQFVSEAIPLDVTAVGATPIEQVAQMDAQTFFTRLNTLLLVNPPAASDQAVLERLGQIGIGAQKGFSPAATVPLQSLDMSLGEGRKALEAAVQKVPKAKLSNGWQILYELGSYQGDYLRRAAVAQIGLGANLSADLIYPIARVDAANQAFSGAHRYVLHFDRNQLPPVQGLWSLTLYNDRQFLAENPINRYKIGQLDQLVFNADGSLDLYIQNTSPGADKEANWLPAPAEGFSLIMRLYWPRQEVFGGTWAPPAVIRVD